MRRLFALDRPPGRADLREIFGDKALGAVRASVGIASNEADVDRLAEVLAAFPAA